LVLNGFFVARLLGVSYTHFTWEAYAGAYGPGEGGGGAETCMDGIDNDSPANGLIDCQDPQCFTALNCSARAPVMSMPGLLSLGIVLASIGILVLRRRGSEG